MWSLAGWMLFARWTLMGSFLFIDWQMFKVLIAGFQSGDITPAVAGILSSLVTAITGVLTLGAKGLLQPEQRQRQ